MSIAIFTEPEVTADTGIMHLTLSVQIVCSAWAAPVVAVKTHARVTVTTAQVASVFWFWSIGYSFLSAGSLLCYCRWQLFLTSMQLFWSVLLQMVRSAARSSEFILMFRAFISLLHTSLYLGCGRPTPLCPAASSPQRMSFGIRPSSIRRTWPSQRSWRCLSRVFMEDIPARDRTSVLVILSCQNEPNMRRRLLRWKVLSLFSWRGYVVHVSLPYNKVLSTQTLYTAIFGVVVNLTFVHTLDLRRARVVAAFQILLSISALRERLSAMVDPRYVNLWKTSSSSHRC